jgi:hypothetical protein
MLCSSFNSRPINILLFIYDLIRIVKNIFFFIVSPHPIYGSPNLQHYHPSEQIYDEQQQAQLTGTETTGVRSATVPQMGSTSKTARNEVGETDESSVASIDFAHTDLVDIPGSWRYRSLPDGRSIPLTTAGRRYRAPIPQSFLDSQQYASDSEQVVRSSSFRHSQQQQPLVQVHSFGSIPTINR